MNSLHNKKLEKTLGIFNTLSLSQIDKVKLMDRIDHKFTLEIDIALDLLRQSAKFYSVLEVGNYRLSPYISQYYDFADYKLFYDHNAHKANRYKIRHRYYASSNLSFFEIKYKDNKGRTFKSRIADELNSPTLKKNSYTEFIFQKTGLDTSKLKSVLNIAYNRVTLINQDLTERVTLDFDLCFKDSDQTKSFGNVVIVEVKQSKSGGSAVIDMIKAHRIPELGISKYCLGVIALKDNIKYNGFRSKLHLLRKYTNNAINM
jgi:hypothetical protein